MPYINKLLAFTILCTLSFAAHANPIEPSFNVDKDFGSTVWYAPADQAAKQADINFVVGMRPHHAGALTMSADYLTDKGASNHGLKQLAKGIAHNQAFEIKMLDIIENFRKTPNDQLDNFMGMRPAAIHGLAQKLQFTRAPMPGILDINAGTKHVSKRDVEFAKAMIIHHQGALDMAHDYLNDMNAKNGYLRRMCLDILVDQQQEIEFMQSVINKYKGNPDDVKIDASMIHGMEGMSHGHGHGHGHGHHNSHKHHNVTTHHHKKEAKAVTKKAKTPKAESKKRLKPLQRDDMHHGHDHH